MKLFTGQNLLSILLKCSNRGDSYEKSCFVLDLSNILWENEVEINLEIEMISVSLCGVYLLLRKCEAFLKSALFLIFWTFSDKIWGEIIK